MGKQDHGAQAEHRARRCRGQRQSQPVDLRCQRRPDRPCARQRLGAGRSRALPVLPPRRGRTPHRRVVDRRYQHQRHLHQRQPPAAGPRRPAPHRRRRPDPRRLARAGRRNFRGQRLPARRRLRPVRDRARQFVRGEVAAVQRIEIRQAAGGRRLWPAAARPGQSRCADRRPAQEYSKKGAGCDAAAEAATRRPGPDAGGGRARYLARPRRLLRGCRHRSAFAAGRPAQGPVAGSRPGHARDDARPDGAGACARRVHARSRHQQRRSPAGRHQPADAGSRGRGGADATPGEAPAATGRSTRCEDSSPRPVITSSPCWSRCARR